MLISVIVILMIRDGDVRMKKLMMLACIFTAVLPLFGRVEISHRLEELKKKYAYAQDFVNTVSVARGLGFGFGGRKPRSPEEQVEANAALAEANAVYKKVAEEYNAALKEYFIGGQQAQSSKANQ